MPQAIPAIAQAFATWASGVAAGFGAPIVAFQAAYFTAYAAAYAGTTYAVVAGLNAYTKAQIPDPEGGKITRRQPRPVRQYAIGGPTRFSGAYMLRETKENNLAVVLALVDGRLDSISRVYLNDDIAVIGEDGWVVEGADKRYGFERVMIDYRLGLPTETHYSQLTTKFASVWPTSARGDGIASLMMLCNHGSLEFFNRDFPNGEPIPSVVGQCVCYDWRDETQDRADESTWGPSSNPVVWLVHLEWFLYGRSWTRCIEPYLDALTDEADYCDATVATVSGTEPRYRFAGNFFSNTEPAAVRAGILAACDGWLSTNGKGGLVLKAGRYVEPTFTIPAEHIEGYTWRAFQTDEESCNELVVSYVDPDQDYTEVEAEPWRDEAGITATGRIRSENLSLTWVNHHTQARRLAKRKMSRLAAERRGQIRTGIYGLNGLGERYIRVQNPELSSMADVVVEVMNVEVDFTSGQVVFDVILADENIDAWNPATEEGLSGGGVVRPAPEALDVPTIDSIEVFFDSGGLPRLRVTATGPDRDDLSWGIGTKTPLATAFNEEWLADLDPSTPVLMESGIVPQDSLKVIAFYQTGGGTVVRMEDVDAVSVDTYAVEAPGDPTDVMAELVGSDVLVSWVNPSNLYFSSLRVFRSATADFDDATDVSGALLKTGVGAPQSWTDTAPASGIWYYWVVAYTSLPLAGDPAGPAIVTVYETETIAILAAFTTPADDTRAGLIDSLIASLKSAGIWSKLDLLYVRAAADSQAARINWAEPGVNTSSVVGSVTFTADRGFAGDGSTGYLESGRALNALAHGTQNSLCFGTWVLDNATGTQTMSAGTRFVNPRNVSNQVVFSGDGASLTETMADSRGLTVANRSGASAREIYKNGAFVKADTTASTALAADTFWTLRYSGNYSSHQVAVDFVSSSLDATEQAALYNAVNDYLTAVGAI